MAKFRNAMSESCVIDTEFPIYDCILSQLFDCIMILSIQLTIWLRYNYTFIYWNFLEISFLCPERELSSFTDTTHIF